MACRVVWTPDAELDLDVIVEHLAGTLGTPGAASRLLDGMDSLAQTLTAFPLAHELSRDELLASRGFRKALVGSYVVLYLYDEDAHEVAITNVFHTSRDYARLA